MLAWVRFTAGGLGAWCWPGCPLQLEARVGLGVGLGALYNWSPELAWVLAWVPFTTGGPSWPGCWPGCPLQLEARVGLGVGLGALYNWRPELAWVLAWVPFTTGGPSWPGCWPGCPLQLEARVGLGVGLGTLYNWRPEGRERSIKPEGLMLVWVPFTTGGPRAEKGP